MWILVDRSAAAKLGRRANILDSKWVFKKKIDVDEKEKHKARLVIRGFKDRNVYDLSETYAPVSRLPLVRCVFSIINAYDLDVCQLDVTTAFLNGTIDEDMYMEIPEGDDNRDELKVTKVCKLKKSLYGLKISPKRWNIKFTEIALRIVLINDPDEPCLFRWREGDRFIMLLLYVDEILLAGNDKEKMQEVKTRLMKEFKMKYLGEPKLFLAIEIERNRKEGKIILKQESYLNKMLEKFGINGENVHKQYTPMVTRQVMNRQRRDEKKLKDERDVERSVRNVPYREAVGSLLYLSGSTRPDIAYATNVLSRHQVNPTNEDWQMILRVFRYLKGTKEMGLRYCGNRKDVQAYSDASFADCEKSISTCGFVIRLFDDTVMWRTRKQTYVALSMCHAEYVAMSMTCQELVALNRSIELILNKSFHPITLFCDNKAAETCTKMNGGNKLRHMTVVSEHYVKECVQRNLVTVRWISTRDQIADIFTKPLSRDAHARLTNIIMNDM